MASTQPLKDKVIAITGAGSGMGRALAQYVSTRGAHLSLCDIQGKGLDETVSSIRETSPSTKIITRVVDVREESDVDSWIESTIKEFGQLHGAANLAGVFGSRQIAISEMDENEWNFVLGINLTGMMHCLRAELRAIADYGSIVNASSVAAFMGSSQYPAYTISKLGVVSMTKCAAKEVGARGVRVNCVCPGTTQTPMLQHVDKIVKDNTFFDAPPPIARVAQPQEIAALVTYLLADESKFITGAEFKIDGGKSC